MILHINTNLFTFVEVDIIFSWVKLHVFLSQKFIVESCFIGEESSVQSKPDEIEELCDGYVQQGYHG